MSIVRTRLSPEESRLAALDAARALLIEAGPQAVTLKAVAGRIGRTHANLLHHFGSAAGLQRALAGSLAESVCATIGAFVLSTRHGEADMPSIERALRQIVDMTFDAFDAQGAGALCTWMVMTGNLDALDSILDAIHNLLDRLHEPSFDEETMHRDTLGLVLMAMGDSMLGAPMAKALALPREAAREIALGRLLDSPRVANRLGLV